MRHLTVDPLSLSFLSLCGAAFYTGPIAQTIIEDIVAAGGIMTLEDLGGYAVQTRDPVVGFYRGRRVLTSPPPSSGPVLLFLLNVLEGYDLAALGRSGEAYQ